MKQILASDVGDGLCIDMHRHGPVRIVDRYPLEMFLAEAHLMNTST